MNGVMVVRLSLNENCALTRLFFLSLCARSLTHRVNSVTSQESNSPL